MLEDAYRWIINSKIMFQNQYDFYFCNNVTHKFINPSF